MPKGKAITALVDTVWSPQASRLKHRKQFNGGTGLVRKRPTRALGIQRRDMAPVGNGRQDSLEVEEGHFQWKVTRRELVQFSALYPSPSDHPTFLMSSSGLVGRFYGVNVDATL